MRREGKLLRSVSYLLSNLALALLLVSLEGLALGVFLLQKGPLSLLLHFV